MNDIDTTQLPANIQLTGRALEEAKELHRLYKYARTAQEELQQRLQREADALVEGVNLQMSEGWKRLLAAQGLPDAALGHYGLDAKYLDAFGLAFLEKRGTCACGADHGDPGAGIEAWLANLTNAGGARH